MRKGAKQHMIHLSRTFLGGIGILARAQVSLGPSNNTVLKIAVQSKSAAMSKMVAESISWFGSCNVMTFKLLVFVLVPV